MHIGKINIKNRNIAYDYLNCVWYKVIFVYTYQKYINTVPVKINYWKESLCELE